MQTKIRMIGFEYGSGSEAVIDEIARNISVLLGTPEGTCAGDRRYGISWDFVGLPGPAAENMLTLELAEKLPLYEPRADILGVTCSFSLDGDLTAIVRVEPSSEYESGNIQDSVSEA